MINRTKIASLAVCAILSAAVLTGSGLSYQSGFAHFLCKKCLT